MFTALTDHFLHWTCSTGLECCHMESCSVEMKQQHNLLMLKSPALQGQWTGAKLTLKKKKKVWTSVQHTMEGSKTPKWAAPCSKPCTTTLKCLQPSLHEGCQKLHSNTDQDRKSLLSFRISCERTKWHSRLIKTDKQWSINAKLKLGSSKSIAKIKVLP